MKLKFPFDTNAWLQLIRFPNLMTLPGDILIGTAAAATLVSVSIFDTVLLIIVSAFLYMGGLILNDLFDYNEDLRERPSRPLPSGQISKKHAWSALAILHAAALLMSLAINTTAFYLTLSLIILIWIYNGPAKRSLASASVFMGACRSNNILLGAASAGIAVKGAWIAALTCGAYISAVTAIAYDETRQTPNQRKSQAPFIMIAAGLFLTLAFSADFTGIYPLLSLAGLIWMAWQLYLRVINCPSAKAVPPLIGQLIRLLIPIQATFMLIFAPSWIIPALFLWSSIKIAQIASRKFYSS